MIKKKKFKRLHDLLDNYNEKSSDYLYKELNRLFIRHKRYSIYKKYDDENDINSELGLFFSNTSTWEDNCDKRKYACGSKKINFVRCLSYQQDESVAMWYMYGHPNNIRLEFNGKALRNNLGIVNNKNITLSAKILFKNNSDSSNKNIVDTTIESNKINSFDLLYYSKKNDSYYLRRDLFERNEYDKEKGDKLKEERFLKRYAFGAEFESRLEISFEKEEIEKLIESRKIDDIIGIFVCLKGFTKVEAYKPP